MAAIAEKDMVLASMLFDHYILPPDGKLVLVFFSSKKNSFCFVFYKMNTQIVFCKPITEKVEISVQGALYMLNTHVSKN